MAERTLGDFLKQVQQKHNLTWEEIAEELGVSVMTIHRWRKGERFPRERDWSALIEFCGPEIGPYLIEQGRERHEAYIIKRQHKREAVLSSQDDTPVESVPEVVSPARSAPPVEPVAPAEDEPTFVEYVIPKHKVYHGWRAKEWDEKYKLYIKTAYITVDGQPLPYFNSHGPLSSPEGPSDKWYEWGYSGTGPRELATAILADYFGEQSPRGWADSEEYQAVRYRYDFKDDFVQWFPKQSWLITSEEIEAWLEDFKEREKNLEKAGATDEERWYWNDKERWQKGWERHQRWKRKLSIFDETDVWLDVEETS